MGSAGEKKKEGASLNGTLWGELEEDYDELCARCEIHVTLNCEADRRAIFIEGGLYCNKSRTSAFSSGRILARNVPRLLLEAGDRLEPSVELVDTGKLRVAHLPLRLTFWRRHMQSRACTDRVLHRNPLFAEKVGRSPQLVLRIDTLHGLYLGPMARYVLTVIWRVLLSNPWKFAGPDDMVLELGVRNLKNDLLLWYEVNHIDLDMQLKDLTVTMLGSRDSPELKTKAAETQPLVRWAIDLCQKHSFEDSMLLHAAGLALVEYMGILKAHSFHVPIQACNRLMFLCLRHLNLIQRASVTLVPKHHQWVHLTIKIPIFGNPRFYSTFLDESLNLVVASMASASHQSNLEKRVFDQLCLLPLVQQTCHFAATRGE